MTAKCLLGDKKTENNETVQEKGLYTVASPYFAVIKTEQSSTSNTCASRSQTLEYYLLPLKNANSGDKIMVLN